MRANSENNLLRFIYYNLLILVYLRISYAESSCELSSLSTTNLARKPFQCNQMSRNTHRPNTNRYFDKTENMSLV